MARAVCSELSTAPLSHPRPDDAADFISKQAHSIDALLRYKELNRKSVQQGRISNREVELYVIDLVDKANRKTRYFISARTFRILAGVRGSAAGILDAGQIHQAVL